jgi:hypothetical protein
MDEAVCSVCGVHTSLYYSGVPYCINCDNKRMEVRAALFHKLNAPDPAQILTIETLQREQQESFPTTRRN